MNKVLIFASVLLALWLSEAKAEVWGFVDARGVAHFANSALDERYELFVRDDAVAGASGSNPGTARAVAVPTGSIKLLAFFEVSPSYKRVKHHLRAAAQSQGLDYELLQALIAAESGFDAAVVSPRGAVGLMQVMPVTALRYGLAPDKRLSVSKQLADPQTNILVGTRYLAALLQNYGGRVDLALAAYNAGEGAVRRAGNQVPPIKETQDYVRTVLQLYRWIKPPVQLLAGTTL